MTNILLEEDEQGIHSAILETLREHLETELIDKISTSDGSRAGVVKIGPLQGQPEVDSARISVTLHENDPDTIIGSQLTAMSGDWSDEPFLEEIGATNWDRKFTVMARLLLEDTRESLTDARRLASRIRTKLERALRTCDYSDIDIDGETVSQGLYQMSGELYQAGGPDSYDFHLKIRFITRTTEVFK